MTYRKASFEFDEVKTEKEFADLIRIVANLIYKGVMATQNPIELEGAFPLPEARLDRFLLKISLG